MLRWRLPVAIKLYEGLNVLLLLYSLEDVSEPFPLTSNKPLEALTTVKKGSVEIEDHGLNARQHLLHETLVTICITHCG